jgi:hypothetical protein
MRDWYVWVIVGLVAAVWGCWIGIRREREFADIRLDRAIDQQKRISLEEGRAQGWEKGFADCKSAVESMIWDETLDRVYRAVHALHPMGPVGKTQEEAYEAAKYALADWRSKFARVVAKRREEGLLTDKLYRES